MSVDRYRAKDGTEVDHMHDGEMFVLDDNPRWQPAVTFRPVKAEDAHRILTLEKTIFDGRYTQVEC